jgi:serine/threonine protein kinase
VSLSVHSETVPKLTWSYSSFPPEKPPNLGERFQLLEELGRGGMGVVYRAHDRVLGREVALKTLHPGRAGEIALQRMWREARAAAALRHPGVVAVHECLELPAGLCLVQELLDGARPLSEALAELPLEGRLDLFREVLAALAHAHREGVVHRDLKPDNILVDREGRARVSDFGLAWQDNAESLTQTGATLGTPRYMAPEQFGVVAGETRSPAVDVWALGVLLYETLTGQLPFHGSTLMELMAAVSRSPRPPSSVASKVSPALERVCSKSLEIKPEARYPDAGALLEALDLARAAPHSRASPTRLALWSVAATLGLGAVAVVASGALSPSSAPAPSPTGSPINEPLAAPEVPLGWVLQVGQEWTTTFGYHSTTIREGADERESAYDMQYSLRLRVVSVARGELATLRVGLERIRFAMRDGDRPATVIDSAKRKSAASPPHVTLPCKLPPESGFTLKMELPSGRIQSVNGASALKRVILARASNVERFILDQALVDLDNRHLTECLGLLLATFPPTTTSRESWKRRAVVRPAGIHSVSMLLETERSAPNSLAWRATSANTDSKSQFKSLSGRSTLMKGGLSESRADLLIALVQGEGPKLLSSLSFIYGSDRPPPLESLSR